MSRTKILMLLLIGFTISACDKDKTHSSLLGSWKCDEYPEISLPSTFQVNIVRNSALSSDSSQYVIYNFNNLGFDEEHAVYIKQESTDEVVITGTNIVGISVVGSGTIAADYSSIEWEYTVNKDFKEDIRATYY
ncbi:MAG TPA: hypothetical protein DEH15_07530 [Marinilabiliales bacterium]|jgi:hypothetical protein|nr:hypothetical protein [Marinilabiliales bacterium]HBY52288.1 hypothetical protein [Marinilabiliales bacterium]